MLPNGTKVRLTNSGVTGTLRNYSKTRSTGNTYAVVLPDEQALYTGKVPLPTGVMIALVVLENEIEAL